MPHDLQPPERRRDPIERRRDPIERRRDPIERRRDPIERRRDPTESLPTAAATQRRRPRILMVAEHASLAQVVRLRQLAVGLPAEHYEVLFACSRFDPMIFSATDFTQVPIASMSPEQMVRRQRWGLRPFGHGTLRRYVREELRLLERLAPDLIVGDLRLSLSISAPVLGIPYAALINAYWSPFAQGRRMPMPEHPVIELLGRQRVAPHFEKALPFVFRHFAAPVNRLRSAYGLPPVGDLLQVLTHGDYTLYPDVPALTPTTALPPSHHYLGPVLWAPPGHLPDAVSRPDPQRRPLVYVTMGSSGSLRVVRQVLRGLADLPVRVLLSTAGRYDTRQLPDNATAVPFVPGNLAAQAADVVICNGGSSSAYQALSEGVPVLGLPANMDQYLAMSAIEQAGAGIALPSGVARAQDIAASCQQLLRCDLYRAAAARVQVQLSALDSAARFRALVARWTAAARTGMERSLATRT